MAHILLVDDDELMRALLSGVLRRVNHTVIEADNGRTALQILKKNSVDLIMTDIFMPEMDGMDLLTSILSRYPDSKIIAISGGYKAMNAQLSLRMARGFGAVDVIAKPFRTADVIRKVARALQPTNSPIRKEA
ncbi:MAG: response regulator [Magnetococcales bacterium]|nr:response regulator [Magnetococcales bacterium]